MWVGEVATLSEAALRVVVASAAAVVMPLVPALAVAEAEAALGVIAMVLEMQAAAAVAAKVVALTAPVVVAAAVAAEEAAQAPAQETLVAAA